MPFSSTIPKIMISVLSKRRQSYTICLFLKVRELHEIHLFLQGCVDFMLSKKYRSGSLSTYRCFEKHPKQCSKMASNLLTHPSQTPLKKCLKVRFSDLKPLIHSDQLDIFIDRQSPLPPAPWLHLQNLVKTIDVGVINTCPNAQKTLLTVLETTGTCFVAKIQSANMISVIILPSTQ